MLTSHQVGTVAVVPGETGLLVVVTRLVTPRNRAAKPFTTSASCTDDAGMESEQVRYVSSEILHRVLNAVTLCKPSRRLCNARGDIGNPKAKKSGQAAVKANAQLGKTPFSSPLSSAHFGALRT